MAAELEELDDEADEDDAPALPLFLICFFKTRRGSLKMGPRIGVSTVRHSASLPNLYIYIYVYITDDSVTRVIMYSAERECMCKRESEREKEGI